MLKPAYQPINHQVWREGQQTLSLRGIMMHWLWCQLVLDNQKIIETRRKKIAEHPNANASEWMWLVQAKGDIKNPHLNTSADVSKLGEPPTNQSIVGVIKFGQDYKYDNEAHWAAESHLHCVHPAPKNKKYAFCNGLHAWNIEAVYKLREPIQLDHNKYQGGFGHRQHHVDLLRVRH